MVNLKIWSDLLACLRQSIRYLRVHALVSTRLSCALSNIVWLTGSQFVRLCIVTLGLLLALGCRIWDLGLHLICLSLAIILVSLIKSLQPRYRFLYNYKCVHTKQRHKGSQPLLECVEHGMKPSSSRLSGQEDTCDEAPASERPLTLREAVAKLLAHISERRNVLDGSCAHSATDGNIQSIYKQLSWSSTRPEFESVYWFNHTVQTLWPAAMKLMQKLVDKALIRGRNKPNASFHSARSQPFRGETRSRFKLIKEGEVQRRGFKLSDFLSCRRQLELLHKNKRRVMKQGDEYLGRKLIMMSVYLTKKFILCFKQYLIDQLFHLLANLLSDKFRSVNLARDERPLLEIDLGELFARQNVKFKLDKRATKSASEALNRNQKPAAAYTRFRSAPESGLACNSRRVINSGHLISFDGIRSLRNKRQKLVRSINEMVLKKRADRASKAGNQSQRPIKVEMFNLGTAAPKVTAIKFLEKDDILLADTLIGNSATTNQPVGGSNTMRLIIELTFNSGREFRVQLSSVPILDSLNLTKFNLRLRLLVSVNHMDFDDHKNLEIRRAVDSSQSTLR